MESVKPVMLDKQHAETIVDQVELALQTLHECVVTLEPIRGSNLHEKLKREIGLAIGNIDFVLHSEIFKIYPELDRIDQSGNLG